MILLIMTVIMTWTQRQFMAGSSASLLMLVLLSITSAESTQVHYIHWNSSNPIFRIDNTDHIIDVNAGNLPWEYDQANIICPGENSLPSHHPEGGGGPSQSSEERYIIYNVTKEEYESCRITNPHPRVIAVCNKPKSVLYVTLTFRSFTPTPGGMEFKPGRDYYFISTSTPDDLHRKVGGRCSTHNMKVVFKVAHESGEEARHPGLNSPRGRHPMGGKVWLDREEAGVVKDASLARDSFFYPREEVARQQEVDPEDNLIYKRLKEPQVDYSENEVIKQEASRMQRGGANPSGMRVNGSNSVRSQLWLSKWSLALGVSLIAAWVSR